MRVRFNFHSSFLVELNRHILVFDYYGNDLNRLGEIDDNKEIIFFASHRHGDHFSKDVFKFKDIYKDVKFVLSDDIWIKSNNIDIFSVSKNKLYDISGIKIETLKSTDEGVAFLISSEDKVIYHAGDLHWWYWADNGEDYVRLWGQKYFDEIENISKRHIDVAFVVLDPRMKSGYKYGLEEFMKRVPDTKVIFPMHMWGDYDIIQRYKRDNPDLPGLDRVMEIKKEGQEFYI